MIGVDRIGKLNVAITAISGVDAKTSDLVERIADGCLVQIGMKFSVEENRIVVQRRILERIAVIGNAVVESFNAFGAS